MKKILFGSVFSRCFIFTEDALVKDKKYFSNKKLFNAINCFVFNVFKYVPFFIEIYVK